MPPQYGIPDYDFPTEIHPENPKGNDDGSTTQMAMWYLLVLIIIIVIWLILYFMLRLLTLRQKTRNPQQRRAYMGSRSTTTVPAVEPTIYVSPANLPPPPKYEAMAPPSYEEVVGIHYPGYQPPGQPINQPITAALATQSNTNTSDRSNIPNADTRVAGDSNNPTNVSHTIINSTTTITTVDETRPVATSS
ncbi:uncharacterized protein LOC123710583 isoform X1 [Pieris brassicae]|uniref:Uncharacterized protein n=1 Tax=Pieris brassicae TaxID=7116 RepID=A0A9P0TJY5_PIEBR|nr:uncharacterized protein LOC123710583 isoform X1 [Pieris brassicae]CAH4029766.1 unnamed protein product [Pieris brassicae]